MLSLDDEIEAVQVLLSISQYIDKRAAVYCKDLESILHYGARLTQFTSDLQILCQSFKGLGQVPFTTAGRFHELNVGGRLLGPDGRVIQSGLDRAPVVGRENWILPFPVECLGIVPDPDAKRLCERLAEEDRVLICRMVDDLQAETGDSTVPAILAYTNAGHDFVKRTLQNDSFRLNLTSVLPPSASLLTAWYEPDVVFEI